MLRLRSPHSRRLWRAAWSGDEQRFRSRFDAACAKERRNLILEVDPTSGWGAGGGGVGGVGGGDGGGDGGDGAT